jgi:hypothetical protein
MKKYLFPLVLVAGAVRSDPLPAFMRQIKAPCDLNSQGDDVKRVEDQFNEVLDEGKKLFSIVRIGDEPGSSTEVCVYTFVQQP